MLDPAVLALFIGLDEVEADSQHDGRRHVDIDPRRERAGIRVALASRLRRAAAALEPRTFGEIADEGCAR